LGLESTAVDRLDAFLGLLAAWNPRTNLTGARTARDRVALLVAAVLPLRTHLLPGEVIDVGSGNGSPGLVLAALEPGRMVTLLEPRGRRWAFLREAARATGRADLRILRCRHDRYPGPPAPNVTLRAVRIPPGELLPLLSPGGRILVLGARPVEDARVQAVPPPGTTRLAGLHLLERADVSRET
jgi:16S rRNA (guanine527-N7)-methyltransferase